MRFTERLTLPDVLRLAIGGRVYFGTPSLAARLGLRIADRLGLRVDATRIDFGHLGSAAGIRRQAYRAAEACIDRLPGRPWATALGIHLGIDFWLVMQKFFFDEFYLRFEFLEMALRYAEEHPDEEHSITGDADGIGAHAARLASRFRVRCRRTAAFPGAATVLLLPLFVEIYFWLKGEAGELRFDDRIVCEVDCEKTLEMFSTLFHDVPQERLAFVVEKRNAAGFAEQHGIGVLGLRRDGLRQLRRAAWAYIRHSLRHWRDVVGFGSGLFWLFYRVGRGLGDTIAGSGNLYCTYEHLVTVKAVRNEFLRASGNRTVFVPMNAHVTPQYYHSEILVNYDVMCAAGPHVEQLYRRKRARTEVFLPTGSYDSHRGVVDRAGHSARAARLAVLKADALAIVLISPGICDATHNIELELMQLARTLSRQLGVRVFVRLKPVPPPPEYADFHRQQTAGYEAIVLTAGEYELFDWLGVGDLFVTSISNAAFDLAQAGAQVAFIDYLKDPELQLCLAQIPGVLIPGEQAVDEIMAWVADKGQARAARAASMARFAAQISYQFPDFASYRRNFLVQLRKFAPLADFSSQAA